MNIRTLLLAASLISATAVGTAAQQAQSPPASPPAGQTQMMMPFELPEACKPAAQGGGQAPMQGMQGQGGMMQNMQGMMANIPDAQKESMQAMMKMGPAMMQGMMVKEPDVAWACAMVPHHMGAIEISKVLLKNGDDPETKKMAEKTIKEQEKEISALKEWLQKRAKK